ncbi:MAG: sigma-70 family RNA polymerase sigma factor [Sphingomonadales bacterium]|nr:sigma-70 family RNA polymerase sigma factor [Sphingomonadales bacterium]PIX66259.1 MAG: RNA polymerase subunit sigma [Sphingomonadales bacterium CG_4_10_14_3_um_filter_58_15]NCO47533.1 sigma-70 family RNA polymerase sigma factor [Sphingomonadales bacterium]NCP00659.1 sigma-70 family RNA polymerase sigma factor [Sphingomonadales bacterium]NCP44474.1 sigma-70 family RNA polymerase sigma factor [Sphingomonadales bacterium]
MEQFVSAGNDPALAGSVFDERFLVRVRDEMLRFARLQLGNDAEVEDAVQEALAGALKNARSFHGEAALKTWIIAILKNKLADILRRRQKHPVGGIDLGNDDVANGYPAAFNHKGRWHNASRPSHWGDPEAALNSRQFLDIFNACLDCLPAQQGRIFMMREVIELSPAEICTETGLSISNIYVILHRARLGLRACLEHNWFGSGTDPC